MTPVASDLTVKHEEYLWSNAGGLRSHRRPGLPHVVRCRLERQA